MQSLKHIDTNLFKHRIQNIENKYDETLYFFQQIKNQSIHPINDPSYRKITNNTFFWNSFFKNVFRINDKKSWEYIIKEQRRYGIFLDAARVVKHSIMGEPILIPLFIAESLNAQGIILLYQSKTMVVLDIENSIVWKIAKAPFNHTEVIGEIQSRKILESTNFDDIAPKVIEKDLDNNIQSIGIELLKNARPIPKYKWTKVFINNIAPILIEFYKAAGIKVISGNEYIELLKKECRTHKDHFKILKLINLLYTTIPNIEEVKVYISQYHGEILPHHTFKLKNSIKIIDWGRKNRGNILYDIARQEFSWPYKNIWRSAPSFDNVKYDKLSLGLLLPFIDTLRHKLNIKIDLTSENIMFNYIGCLIEYWNNIPTGVTGPARHKLVTILNLLNY